MISRIKLNDVVRLLVSTDKTTEQIGDELGVGRTTARNYISEVYQMYGLDGMNPKRHLLRSRVDDSESADIFRRSQLGRYRDQIRMLENKLLATERERDDIRAKYQNLQGEL